MGCGDCSSVDVVSGLWARCVWFGMSGESLLHISFFFFFQAEDGIRDYKVTGVQTCALPISRYQNKIQGEIGPPDPSAAVVYLEGNFPASSATNPPSVRMEQKRFQFAPGIQIGRASCRERV